MIASLPMYDWPELQPATDALWEGLQKRLVAKGISAPHKLTRTVNSESTWLSPDLVFGNTCGYTLATELLDQVTYLATPTRDIEGCEGTFYSSAIVVHRDCDLDLSEMRSKRFAYNSIKSWSGFQTLSLEIGEPEQYFGLMLKSGEHRLSARMVADKTADIAALDAICWHYLQRHEPQTASKLRVIEWSSIQPAPPFITSMGTSPDLLEELQASLAEVLSDDETGMIADLLAISGCEVIDPDRYLTMDRKQ